MIGDWYLKNDFKMEKQQRKAPFQASPIRFVIISGRAYPFRLGVTTDNFEVCTAAAANTCEEDLSAADMPGGILGFALGFEQKAC